MDTDDTVMSLPTIITQMNAITQRILEAHGELVGIDELLLDEVNLALTHKVDAYAFIDKKLEAEAKFWTDKASYEMKIGQAHEKARLKLREAMKVAMIAMDRNEVLGDEYKFKLIRSTPKLIIDESKLPERFKTIVTTVEIDKESIREELKKGLEIPGVVLQEKVYIKPFIHRKV